METIEKQIKYMFDAVLCKIKVWKEKVCAGLCDDFFFFNLSD